MIISYAPALEVFLYILASIPFSISQFLIFALCVSFGAAFVRFLLDL